MGMNRRTYEAEFKRNAVLVINKLGRTASKFTKSLGIGVDLIARWLREMRKQDLIVFPGWG